MSFNYTSTVECLFDIPKDFPILYSKEIKKVRGLFHMEQYIMKLIVAHNDCRVKAEDVLNLFKKYMDIEADISENFEISSIVEVKAGVYLYET